MIFATPAPRLILFDCDSTLSAIEGVDELARGRGPAVLAACEGSLLVVDASQGVEAQTLANVYQAIDQNHEIVPVLNKVDLPAADVARVKEQIEDIIGLDTANAVEISAKTGLGIPDVLEAIVKQLPPPRGGDVNAPLKAALVDAYYDPYLGVVVIVRVHDGVLKKKQSMAHNIVFYFFSGLT